MKEIIFNKNKYFNYKELYVDIYKKLNGKENHDFDFCSDTLGCSADILNEFLWYYHNDNIKYIFVDFDKEKIALKKNYDDYKYNLIIEVFEEFVAEFPNNKLEFRIDEEK